MLAYLFWHRPKTGIDFVEYERRLIGFHEALAGIVKSSATFRLEELPFANTDGYEDWYIIEGWTALGVLNDAAVDDRRRDLHDASAELSAEGWGGVYGLLRGESEPPPGARWTTKPDGESLDAFLEREGASSVWRRRLVLGPAAEFCLGTEQAHARERIWASRSAPGSL